MGLGTYILKQSLVLQLEYGMYSIFQAIIIVIYELFRHSMPEALKDKQFVRPEDSLAEGYPILLYLHGNSGSRAGSHRIELYQILQSLDYHVVTFDYRGEFQLFSTRYNCVDELYLFTGYADSSQDILMCEDGVVTDAVAVYQYIKKHSQESKVVVWGHSLGTG